MSTPSQPLSDNESNRRLQEQIAAATDKTKIIPLSQATPLKAKVAASKGKPVPVKYAHILKIEYCRDFTFADRIKILFGAKLVIMAGIATRHNPGEFQPLVVGRVSNQTTATDYMKFIVSNMLDEQSPPSIVQHEPEE